MTKDELEQCQSLLRKFYQERTEELSVQLDNLKPTDTGWKGEFRVYDYGMSKLRNIELVLDWIDINLRKLVVTQSK